MRVGGVPFDPARVTHGTIRPSCGVLHRTYGRWAGDYSVGKAGRPAGFHFLIGKDHGQWVQFADTTAKCWHAGGWPNSSGVGIEFTGVNQDQLTEWQVQAGAWIIAAVNNHHGIPFNYYHGPRTRSFNGWLTHASVYGSDHTDMVSRADWDRMARYWAAAPQRPAPAPATVDWAAVRRLSAAQTLTTLRQLPEVGPGANPLYVIVIQQALNILGTNPRLAEDGIYDDDLIRAVVAFQQWRGIKDRFPGITGAATRWWLVTLLQKIVEGKA